MLTQAEAKSAILEEWYAWPKGARDKFYFDGLTFFNMLQRDKGHLLSFKHSGPIWHVVKGMIEDRGYSG